VFKQLLAEGVIVRPMAVYDLPEHIRVTVGTMEENRKFIEALNKVIKAF
jgi:histidinol-phosphate aminotransferase